MNKKNIMKLCVVIPAYNEATALEDVLRQLNHALDISAYKSEIVVVDDGSTDETAIIAQNNSATVIKHILNSGAGGATATGLSYAQQHHYDLAATMDADGQHDAKDVIRCVDELVRTKSDLLIGSRLINSKGMSKVKILGNKGLSLITYLLFGINITDSQSGLRVFSRNSLEQLKWKTRGYEFCSEMLWRANQQGLRIHEYPIKAIYTDYSKSKGQNNWNAFNIINSLIKRRITELLHE